MTEKRTMKYSYQKYKKKFNLYIIAFIFYIIGTIVMIFNYGTLGMLHGIPFIIIGLILTTIGYFSGHILQTEGMTWL